MRSKRWILLLACVLLLTACGTPETPETDEPYSLRVSIDSPQGTLDPARNTSGETILYHLYENLLRWEDDGSGWGTPVSGQAQSWTVETDFAGNATYTFQLRPEAAWSDGKAVKAEDFVWAWRRLADPANDLPHRELLSVISGYAEVQETGDTEKLAVSAPDEGTLIVELEGNPAYFLTEVCAGAHTMPLREDLESSLDGGAVTNGAYCAVEQTPALVRLERSVTYYDTAAVGPFELEFVDSQGPEEDYQQLQAGELDFAAALPDSVLQEAEEWTPEPVTSVYGVLFNSAAPPFDDPNIRQAFRLVIDTESIAAERPTLRPAGGLVPYGVADYDEKPERAEDDDSYWDFRAHSLEKVTMPEAGEYEENCRLAKQMLSQAGYPRGDGFPLVEYVYVDEGGNAAAAQALRQMWQEQLGIAVTLRGVSQEEYDARVAPTAEPEKSGDADGESEETKSDTFQLAGCEFRAAYNDAAALLEYWESGNTGNPTGYANEAFDLIMQAARTAAAEARDALLHDAEALLLKDGPVFPLYCSGGSYALAEKWSGFYRNPDGVYFLYRIKSGS